MKGYVTVGLTVLAGAALLEAALIPGILIGAAAVLAPSYLPKPGRRRRPASGSKVQRRSESALPLPERLGLKAPAAGPAGLRITQAIAKTITFRMIVTTLDFTTNYVVVGDVLTAAGLSAFAFVVGPFVYLGHEKAWDYYNSPKADAEVPLRLVHQASRA